MIPLFAHHEAIANPLVVTCVAAAIAFAYRFAKAWVKEKRLEDGGRQR